jgi:ribosomal protein S18 acetylase RimI-like enzyme
LVPTFLFKKEGESMKVKGAPEMKKTKVKSLNLNKLTFREDPWPTDVRRVRDMVRSSNFFSEDETDLAMELVEERLQKGLTSGYHFLFAEKGDGVLGYACFGPIPCTVSSFDLYWIVVDNSLRGSGLGREILDRVERNIMAWGGKKIYVETSSRLQYRPTRAFYSKCGYRREALLKDFYAPGDHKMIFTKDLSPDTTHRRLEKSTIQHENAVMDSPPDVSMEENIKPLAQVLS